MKTTLKAPVIQLAGRIPAAWMAITVAFGIAGLPAHGQSPLTITCPTNFSVWTCATNPVIVSYPPPTVTGSCPGISTNCTPRSGTFFPMGVTTVTCEATNSCGEQAACTFTITVLSDTNPPTIACPSNITVQCLANVPAPPATLADFFAQGGQASDDHTLTLSYICTDTPLSGGTCGGTILRTHTVTDDCVNSANCVQIITVRDTIAPLFTSPTNRTVECGTAWAFETPTATDNCSGSNVVTSILSTVTNGLCGQTFSATRTWLATDACGNSNTCAQTVTVVDTTPPWLVCPSNLLVSATSSNGAVVSFTVTAGDNCDPSPTVTCTPPSDSVFPLGTNSVVCRAVDVCSNESSCGFTITVVQVPRVISVGSADGRTIGVQFDREVDQFSAETLGNYTFDTWSPFRNFSNAMLRPNARKVELTLDQPLPAQASFSVTVSNVSAMGPCPTIFPVANGQASGRVLRFNTVAIGDPNLRIDAFTADNQALELTGGGGAAWYPSGGGPGLADNIAFTCRTLTGDFDVVARVGGPSPALSNAVGGLMVRDSLSVTSRMAALVFDAAQAKAIWLVRSNDGGAAQIQGELPLDPDGGWLRLRRVDDTLTAFASTNGSDWSTVGSVPPLNESEPKLVGFAVGSSQAGEVASSMVPQFEYRNYYLELIPFPPGGFGFSWYGPGTVQETPSVYGPPPLGSPSAVSVEQNADERWVIFEVPIQGLYSSRFFWVQPAPTTNQLYYGLKDVIRFKQSRP